MVHFLGSVYICLFVAELKMLASAVQASGVPDPPVQFPDFSPAEEMEQGATDFVQLNDASKTPENLLLLKKGLASFPGSTLQRQKLGRRPGNEAKKVLL